MTEEGDGFDGVLNSPDDEDSFAGSFGSPYVLSVAPDAFGEVGESPVLLPLWLD